MKLSRLPKKVFGIFLGEVLLIFQTNLLSPGDLTVLDIWVNDEIMQEFVGREEKQNKAEKNLHTGKKLKLFHNISKCKNKMHSISLSTSPNSKYLGMKRKIKNLKPIPLIPIALFIYICQTNKNQSQIEILGLYTAIKTILQN